MPNNTVSNSTRRSGRPIAGSEPRAVELTEALGQVRSSHEYPPRFVAIASWGTVAVAVSVLLGWVLDIETLKVVIPGLVSMKINTAIAFALIGVSLGLMTSSDPSAWKLAIAKCTAIGAILIGGITICEYLLDWNPGFDQMFIKDPADPKLFPGRPALAASLNFCLLGIALLLLRTERRSLLRVLQGAVLVPFMIGALSLVGHLFGS
jgi:hypothetical protein